MERTGLARASGHGATLKKVLLYSSVLSDIALAFRVLVPGAHFHSNLAREGEGEG